MSLLSPQPPFHTSPVNGAGTINGFMALLSLRIKPPYLGMENMSLASLMEYARLWAFYEDGVRCGHGLYSSGSELMNGEYLVFHVRLFAYLYLGSGKPMVLERKEWTLLRLTHSLCPVQLAVLMTHAELEVLKHHKDCRGGLIRGPCGVNNLCSLLLSALGRAASPHYAILYTDHEQTHYIL
ncbi:hypothetical protein J6590_036463, partial [Homalodisca vitripennis]